MMRQCFRLYRKVHGLCLRFAAHLMMTFFLIACFAPAMAQESSLFETPGEETYVVPDDVTEVTVEVWGSGGAGGAVTERGASGGGGGGAYARTRLSVSPGDQLIVQVGAGGTSQSSAGDSWVAQSGQVVAHAEAGASVAANESGGARGGRAAQSIGDEARYSGGRGADGLVRGWFGRLQGGGGGSSAGTGANGENGDEDTGGAAPDGGGDGGDGSDTAGLGSSGGSPGGRPGGGGGGATTRALLGGDFPGGTGADGQVRISRASSGGDVGVGCKASFPDGISSYNGGQIHFGQNAQLIGSPDSRLEAGIISKNDGSSLGTCGNNDCTATNSPVAALNLPEFPAINAPSDTSVYLGYREARTIGDSGNNRFSSIGTGFQAELSFSADYDTYYIGTLNLGSSSTVFLQPGDYYIESISINSQVDIQVLGSGTARLFVRNDVNSGSPTYFNSPGIDEPGNVSKLLLASYGDISLNNNATVSGAVFALGDINLGSASYVYGGATAGNITLRARSKLYFESQGMADVDFGGVCDGEQGEQVDHFLILHGGTGVTCQPTPITFEARDAQGDIVTDYDGQVALSTSTGQGFWQVLGGSAGNLTLVPGDSGEASFQFDTADGGVATLGLQHTQPDTVNLNITDGDTQELPSADPDLLVQKAGFIFHQSNDFSVPIGSQVSGKPSQDQSLTAVRKSDETGACEAFLVGSQTVNIGVVCDDPENCSDSGVMQVNGATVGKNSQDTYVNQQPIEFDFGDDATSSASLTLEYNDAGRVKLFASMPLMDDEGNPTGETIFGSSDPFVVVPAGLCVQPADPAEDICTLDDVERYSDCDEFATAGEEFELRITAVGWESDDDLDYCEGNLGTPNFELEGIALSSEVVGPDHEDAVDGDVFRILDGEEKRVYGHTISAEGMMQLDDVRQAEVGVFKFIADASEIKYFGLDGPRGVSEPVGRFKPDGFKVDIADPGELDPSCTGLNFIGQPLKWHITPSLRITALNSRDAPTENYPIDEGFRKLKGSDITIDFPETQQDIHEGETDLDVAFIQNDGKVVPALGPGEMYYEFSADDRIWFEKNKNARVAGFPPKLPFAIQAFSDSDGVPSGDLPDPFLTGPEETDPDSFKIYYGRLNMENVYGPQTAEKLLMPVHVEVWNGSSWDIIDVGSCMPTNLADIKDSDETTQNYHDLDDAGFDESSDGGNYYLTLKPKTGSCSDGDDCTDTLEWPLASGAGLEAGDIPEEHDWLRDFWGRGADPDELQNPRATATFGVYRGNDRIIYWQEVLN